MTACRKGRRQGTPPLWLQHLSSTGGAPLLQLSSGESGRSAGGRWTRVMSAAGDTALEERPRRGPAQGTCSLVWAFPAGGNSQPAKKQWLLEPSTSAGRVQWKGEQVSPPGSWGSYSKAWLGEASQAAPASDWPFPLQSEGWGRGNTWGTQPGPGSESPSGREGGSLLTVRGPAVQGLVWFPVSG